MNKSLHSSIAVLSGSVLLSLSSLTSAADQTISAIASCEDVLGSTIESGGGIKASGGTAVVRCPLTKNVGSNTLTSVYARMKRDSAAGADPFCYVYTSSNYGTPTQIGYGYATTSTNNQSVSVSIPTQYYSGYADLYCVLNVNDSLFGARYIQN